jgi:CDP-4-dehydro-6-deoxyglucose reductase
MANAPHEEGPVELHIRHMPGGKFTDHVFGAMKERDILRFEGPLGTFFLREDSDKPIVLLASGTGFAPIKAIIEHVKHTGITRPMTLYWGARRKKDLYLGELAEQWAREIPNFKYVPVLSEPDHADQWTGRTGFVHRAVIEDLPDLSGHQVYACGAPVMVESAQRLHAAPRAACRRVLRGLVHERRRSRASGLSTGRARACRCAPPCHIRGIAAVYSGARDALCLRT